MSNGPDHRHQGFPEAQVAAFRFGQKTTLTGIKRIGPLGRKRAEFGLTCCYTPACAAATQRPAIGPTACPQWCRHTAHRKEPGHGDRDTLPILPVLARTLAAGPCTDLAFICGTAGKPLTKASFGNNFRGRCNAAGVMKRAHVRKGQLTRAADNGATVTEAGSHLWMARWRLWPPSILKRRPKTGIYESYGDVGKINDDKSIPLTFRKVRAAPGSNNVAIAGI